MVFESKHTHAPALYGNQWLNGAPVSLYDLDGEISLIDFWDYTHHDCLRSMPYLHEWYCKYRDMGLVIVGVHVPEFTFAAQPQNVQRAIERMQIPYPVMLDNDARAMVAYEIRNLPARFLVDKDGYIRFVQQGEGNYWEFERALQQLLAETGYRSDLPELMLPICDEDRAGAVCYRQTQDFKLGYRWSAIGNVEGISPESTIEYHDPGIYFPDRMYASGKWMNRRECLQYKGNDEELGSLLFMYDAKNVYAVMHSADDSVCTVEIEYDGAIVPQNIFGSDLQLSDKKSVVHVNEPRMYQLIADNQYGHHILKLTTSSTALEVYAVQFTTSIIPELIPLQ